ncbi:hypothetical protein Agabi119p4_10586 [Agaricus bisporus var. burnettii]|uniref:Uncharacterized protein n=1 Tax=Agaricus bisporus var. burnettii TaxID=192524 RepID=A0A8H7C2B4_AGABI|nr:hypothetical protein Agabi119p4_10586 [Agaricus bisporus var. burnettii]
MNALKFWTLWKDMTRNGGGSRDESLKALRCIVDLWVVVERKFKYFRYQLLLHPRASGLLAYVRTQAIFIIFALGKP